MIVLALLATPAEIELDFSHLHQDLFDARKIYKSVVPYPKNAPDFQLKDAISRYKEILARYGHVPAARIGLSNCLFEHGNYRASVEQLKTISQSSPALSKAKRYLQVAESMARQFQKQTVIQVRWSPDLKFWVALLGKPYQRLPWSGTAYKDVVLVLAKMPANHRLSIVAHQPVGKGSKEIAGSGYSPDTLGTAALYVMRKSLDSQRFFAVIYRSFPAADCLPTDVTFTDISSGRIGLSKTFGACRSGSVLPADGHDNLRLVLDTTYKMDWPDMYEWKANGFAYVDRFHPEIITAGSGNVYPEQLNSYMYWMWTAAECDIRKKYSQAIRAWKQAENLCRKEIHREDPADWGDHYWGWNGDPKRHLSEIRQRIKWLQAKDYGHWLLYRPYDWDFQVGRSRTYNGAWRS